MVLGMLFENFKNYYILRYIIYEFLKKVLGGPQPTCLVRVFCAMHTALRDPTGHFCLGNFVLSSDLHRFQYAILCSSAS